MSGGGIQFVCSSWAKKFFILRLKSGGMGFFETFLCVLSFCWCCVTICWMGLCTVFGLKFGGSVIAKFRKFWGNSDSGWFLSRFGSCVAVGVLLVILCSSSYVFGLVELFVLYSLFCASRSILFFDVENIPKKPAISMRATLACLFTCVCIAHVLYIPFSSEKVNPIK